MRVRWSERADLIRIKSSNHDHLTVVRSRAGLLSSLWPRYDIAGEPFERRKRKDVVGVSSGEAAVNKAFERYIE